MNTAGFEKQLESIIQEYETALGKSRHHDASDVLNDLGMTDLQTRCLAAIERIGGRSSIYHERAVALFEAYGSAYDNLQKQIGVAKSLLSDMRNGYTKSLEELVHGEIFGDYLEMADHLLGSGFKDAAAVTAGSTLEAHLRMLCIKHGITTTDAGKPKKADTINAELVKANAYSKLDQKSVTAWLGLRNDAAHGNYGAYDTSQVALFVSSIRDFITRHPA